MARLRSALLVVALATGGAGCATFCDECDDFPIPGGPGGYELMPGSYSGGPLREAADTPPVGSNAPLRPREAMTGELSGDAPLEPALTPPTPPAAEPTPPTVEPTPPAVEPTPPAAQPAPNAVPNPPAPNGADNTALPATAPVSSADWAPPELPAD
jgi:hypothetical protein